MRHTIDEIAQPLWIPPSDWSKDVTIVLIRIGMKDHPKQFTANQNTTLKNTSSSFDRMSKQRYSQLKTGQLFSSVWEISRTSKNI